MTDTELLDWLEKQDGFGLISDDNGHWAVSGSGTQNVPSGDEPEDIMTTFFVAGEEWHGSIRAALTAAIAVMEEEMAALAEDEAGN